MVPKTHAHTVILGADFETDNDGCSEAWVCQWALVRMRDRSRNDSDYTEKHGYTLDEFIGNIESLFLHPSTQYIVYFHNLKYDAQFMRSFLHDLETRFPDALLIIRKGRPIIMRFGNVEFRDSANKMPAGTTVLQMGDMLGLPKLESPRDGFAPGWSADLTDEDFQYVIRDALIVGMMMQRMHRQGHTHATASGDAWASMKAIYNEHHNTNGFGKWNRTFPKITLAMDQWLRPAYFGGVNISQHVGMISDCEITHEDVNSMYPSVMMYDPLPVGLPKSSVNPSAEGYALFVMRARMKLTLREGMIPCFRFKHAADRILEGMAPTDYVIDCESWHTLTLTNIDLENFNRFYRIQILPGTVSYMAFDSSIGENREYLEHWFRQKAIAPKNSVERLAAKLMLNSAYGRFGMSGVEESSTFAWDEGVGDFVITSTEAQSDDIPGYLPYALFVTAHARRRLLDCVLAVGVENVIHCDTDSVIHKGPPSPMGHTDALGDWGIESTPHHMFEGGVKRYVEVHGSEISDLDSVTLTCAGVPQKVRDGVPSGMWIELLDNPDLIHTEGTELGQEHYVVKSEWLRRLLRTAGRDPDDMDTRKLLPKRVKGGVILQPTTFKLHDVMNVRFR